MMKRILVLLVFVFAGIVSLAAQDASEMLLRADSLLKENHVENACEMYEQVLKMEPLNYAALAFLTNYHYTLGMRKLNAMESSYKRFKNPSRMQVARFENELRMLYDQYLQKAENYLIKAYLISRNDYLDQLAGRIADFKVRIGIPLPTINKEPLLKRLLP